MGAQMAHQSALYVVQSDEVYEYVDDLSAVNPLAIVFSMQGHTLQTLDSAFLWQAEHRRFGGYDERKQGIKEKCR